MSGVGIINENYIILYFITCLLISISTVGISAILIRKFDKKSIAILLIIVFISIAWMFAAKFSYKNSKKKLYNYFEIEKMEKYHQT